MLLIARVANAPGLAVLDSVNSAHTSTHVFFCVIGPNGRRGMDLGQRLVCRASGVGDGGTAIGRGRRGDRSENLCASLTSSDLASLKILLAGQREPVRRGVPFRDHSPKSPASSPPMPLSSATASSPSPSSRQSTPWARPAGSPCETGTAEAVHVSAVGTLREVPGK